MSRSAENPRPPERSAPSLILWLASVLATALCLTLADTLFLWSTPGLGDVGGRELLVFAISSIGLYCAVGAPLAAFASVVEMGIHRAVHGERKSRFALASTATAGFLAVAGALFALNMKLLLRRAALGDLAVSWLGELSVPVWIMVLTVVAFAAVYILILFGLFSSYPMASILAGAALLVGAVVAAVANTRYRLLYYPQHCTMTLVLWLLLLPYFRHRLSRFFAGPSQPGPVKAAITCVGFLVVGLLAASSADRHGPTSRLLLTWYAPSSPAAFALFEVLTDLDRDGSTSWLGGGDCSPLNGGIHPEAVDRPGDGVDQNCLGGDTDSGQIAALRARIAGGDDSEWLAESRSVVLITVDALPANHTLPQSEELLAPNCLHFPATYSTAPRTHESLASIFTSRFEVGAYFDRTVPTPNVAEIFAAQGYETAAMVWEPRVVHDEQRPGLRPIPTIEGFLSTWWSGLDNAIPSAELTTDAAIEWLEREHTAPFFLWVHYLDPHGPYEPQMIEASGSFYAAYERVVGYTDGEVHRLLEYLQGLDGVALVLTADHGEAFGEHGTHFHTSTVFEEQIKVASFVCSPGGEAETINVPISHVDLGPTILALGGHASERPAFFQGRVVPVSDAGTSVPVFSQVIYERGSVRAVIDRPWKLIHFSRENTSLLFNLHLDPGENHDISAEHPGDVARLERLLDLWAASN